MKNIYTLADGRVVRSVHPLPNENNLVTEIPPNTECDILSSETNSLLKQAENHMWLPAEKALLLGKHFNHQNFCIRDVQDGTIYISDGRYVKLNDFLKNATTAEKTVVISRIAHQLSFCDSILSRRTSTVSEDEITDRTKAILDQFFVSRCIPAQKRYRLHCNSIQAVLPTDLCRFENNTLYIRKADSNRYLKLAPILKNISGEAANELLMELAQLAATLHRIITGGEAA